MTPTRNHSSISQLTPALAQPFWLRHFLPGCDGLSVFLALWAVFQLSPGCRTWQDVEAAILPFFTGISSQCHLWLWPLLPTLKHPSGMLHPGCARGRHMQVICVHKHVLSWPPPLPPGKSQLTCLISAQPYTPFPGLTLNPPQQQSRELQREDLLRTLPSRPVTASEMWLK